MNKNMALILSLCTVNLHSRKSFATLFYKDSRPLPLTQSPAKAQNIENEFTYFDFTNTPAALFINID